MYNFNALHVGFKISTDDNLIFFSYFSQKTGFNISCKLSLSETICWNVKAYLGGKIGKYIYKKVSSTVCPVSGKG